MTILLVSYALGLATAEAFLEWFMHLLGWAVE